MSATELFLKKVSRPPSLHHADTLLKYQIDWLNFEQRSLLSQRWTAVHTMTLVHWFQAIYDGSVVTRQRDQMVWYSPWPLGWCLSLRNVTALTIPGWSLGTVIAFGCTYRSDWEEKSASSLVVNWTIQPVSPLSSMCARGGIEPVGNSAMRQWTAAAHMHDFVAKRQIFLGSQMAAVANDAITSSFVWRKVQIL